MTLFRQLIVGVSVLFFVLLAGVEAIYLANARAQLQEQLGSPRRRMPPPRSRYGSPRSGT